MILKNWFVIMALMAIGLSLAFYWLSVPSVPDGVTPQSGEDDSFKEIAALSGAITTLGTAVFGIFTKFNDFRAKRLEIAAAELELEKKRRELDKT